MIHQLAGQMRAGKRPRIFKAGQQKRDFVYIADVVQSNLKGMTRERQRRLQRRRRPKLELQRSRHRTQSRLKTDLQPDYFENPYGFTQD